MDSLYAESLVFIGFGSNYIALGTVTLYLQNTAFPEMGSLKYLLKCYLSKSLL